MTYRQCKMSVSHAKVGLYLLYFILFENLQLWILLILQKAILLSNKYNSYFVIFTRKSKKVCKCVCKSQNVCPISLFLTKVPLVALKLILSNFFCMIHCIKSGFSEILLCTYCFIIHVRKDITQETSF